MKKMILLLAAALAIPASVWAKDGDVQEKVVPISDVYVPSGFDSSSDVFLVANGLFPNSCYQLKNTRVEHAGPALHEVTTSANVTGIVSSRSHERARCRSASEVSLPKPRPSTPRIGPATSAQTTSDGDCCRCGTE